VDAAPSLQPHVLVLDDDAAVRDLLTTYLGENDLRVTAVGSGSTCGYPARTG
jgi:CheY-like chemotaxis protein